MILEVVFNRRDRERTWTLDYQPHRDELVPNLNRGSVNRPTLRGERPENLLYLLYGLNLIWIKESMLEEVGVPEDLVVEVLLGRTLKKLDKLRRKEGDSRIGKVVLASPGIS